MLTNLWYNYVFMVINMLMHTTLQQSARILRGQSMVEKGFEPTQINDNFSGSVAIWERTVYGST